MAAKRTVEEKLRELMSRLDGSEDAQGSLAESLPDQKIVAVTLPDIDAEYWTVMHAGRMEKLHRGSPERSDIRIRVDSDHLVELVDGQRSLFSAVMAGQVKIEASISDLLRLRKLA